MASTLQNTIQFLKDFGFFDVIVPFLLFFAISFSILEKTKVLGKDKSNSNLIVALAVSLLAVATNKVVNLVSGILPNMILVLVLFIMFIMVLGLFYKESDEGFEFAKQHKGWFTFFMFLLFTITVLFILNAWTTRNGTALDVVLDSISGGSKSELVGAVIIVAVIIGAVAFVAKSAKKSKD